MGISAAIFGCEGPDLQASERDFFREHQPWGFILFARNVQTREQVSELTASLRACVDHEDVPVLIDQEGGRVRRLRPPVWPDYPAAQRFGEIYREDREEGLRFTWLQSRLMAGDLSQLGINVDCLPVLDVPIESAHEVIGDRAYSRDPEEVADMGLAASKGLVAGGVLPVIKHIPGHGRALADSHEQLPVVEVSQDVLEQTDFLPFCRLSNMPLAMTAHVVYSQIDPDHPATTSVRVIDQIIRGHIGFEGLLMSDDLSMKALSGDFFQRTQQAFGAGCDVVLHCNGLMEEMKAIVPAVPVLEGVSLQRAERAMEMIASPADATPFDEAALREEFSGFCDRVAV